MTGIRFPRGLGAAAGALTLALLAAFAARAVAEQSGAPSARQAPAAPVATGAERAVIEATQVLEAADRVARSLALSGRIPDGAVVTLADGRTRPLAAAQVFVLLTRFLGNGYERGITPEYAPAPPPMMGPLGISPVSVGLEREAIIATADLLAQARPTADVAEGTGNLPTAVWVKGLRLTPAQYMGALATILQYAAMQGAVPQQVAVGNYLPPVDWNAPPSSGALPMAPPLAAADSRPYPGPPEGPPLQEPLAAEPAPSQPQLTVYFPARPPLSGEQALTIEYEGPRAFIRVSIDGRARAVSNMVHFTYVWDTRLEPDGDHALRVAAVDEVEKTLETVEATIATANGNLPLR